MNPAMKPCPFCGGRPILSPPFGAVAFVECANCGTLGPDAKTSDEAVQTWNQRSYTTLDAKIQAMKNAVLAAIGEQRFPPPAPKA